MARGKAAGSAMGCVEGKVADLGFGNFVFGFRVMLYGGEEGVQELMWARGIGTVHSEVSVLFIQRYRYCSFRGTGTPVQLTDQAAASLCPFRRARARTIPLSLARCRLQIAATLLFTQPTFQLHRCNTQPSAVVAPRPLRRLLWPSINRPSRAQSSSLSAASSICHDPSHNQRSHLPGISVAGTQSPLEAQSPTPLFPFSSSIQRRHPPSASNPHPRPSRLLCHRPSRRITHRAPIPAHTCRALLLALN
ncbi:hypothetical protein M0R45_030754 [Rubus argutus]|uniref:Uncharacterized protein n=1 Tax=Rubus argutus TaxID=59490 RepID=A0AAW1WC28_RUBAR